VKKRELEQWQRDLERREQALEERIAKLDKQEQVLAEGAKYREQALEEHIAKLDKQEQVLAEGAKYTEFGSYMLRVANANKGVRGPYRVAKFMAQEAKRRGYDIGVDWNTNKPRKLTKGGAVSKYFLGDSNPPSWWVLAFADLFNLDEEQREELAIRYAYKAYHN